MKNTATTFKAPVRDADTPVSLGPGHAAALDPLHALGVLGRRTIWDTRVNNHNSMFDRTGRLWLAGRGARHRQSRVLQGRARIIRRRRLFPIERDEPAPRRARSEDDEVHVRRHLLRHPPPAVRVRRQRHAVDERRRARWSGWVEHQDVRRDRRRSEGAGLDGVRARHQRQRPARRRTPSRTSRSTRRRTRASTPASTP